MSRKKSFFSGQIDEYRAGAIHGWLRELTDSVPVEFILTVDGQKIDDFHCANLYRKDLHEAGIGEGRHAYGVALPSDLHDGKTHEVSISTARGEIIMSRTLVFSDQHHVNVDVYSESYLSGWLRTQPGQARTMSICSEQGTITTFSNHYARPDVVRHTGVMADHGFQVRIPLAQRGRHEGDTWLETSGSSAKIVLGQVRRRSLRVAFVCNSDNPNDGSRHYRAELAARQLANDGVHTRLFSERQLRETSADSLDPKEWDIVVFQRVPLHVASRKLLENLRAHGQRVLYDVDDLLFKKWRMNELGAIRSGAAQGKESEYASAMEARLRMIMQCDGVICSTAFLQRELAELGIPTLLSRNALEDDFFAYGAQRIANEAPTDSIQPLRLLFMSGSPTHRADFRLVEPILSQLLRQRCDVRLSLLGDVGPSHLDHLPQVSKLARLDREGMMAAIAAHDVVLVPLERTSFNIAKSSLKFIESAAAGVPVIASPMFEFKRDIQASGAGLIANTARQWADAITTYADDRPLCRRHGAQAFAYCWDNYRQGARVGHLLGQILALDDWLLEREHHALQVSREYRRRLIYGSHDAPVKPGFDCH